MIGIGLIVAAAVAASVDDSTVTSPSVVPGFRLWGSTETIVAISTVAGTLGWMPFDRDVNRWAADHRSTPSRVWSAGAKAIGDGYITLPVSGALWFWGEKGGMPRLARASKFGLESWCLTELVTQTLKYSTHRARPSESRSSQDWYGPGIGDSHLSFPSGHSASAWGLLPAFAMEFDDSPILVGALYAAAASTSLSRVHDGQHWMSDVFFSAGLGVLSNRLVRSWNSNRGNLTAVVPLLGPGRQGVAFVSSF